jgi:putative endonuclease
MNENPLRHYQLIMTVKSSKSTWWVYLVRCNDNSLYAGVTTDIERRIQEHNTSKLGAKYTRARRPVSLAYQEAAKNKSLACKREYKIRKLSKVKKESLVTGSS